MSQYKPYPKYKDSGVEWLGQVPAHWEVKPVYAIASLRNGYPFKADLFESEGDPRKRVIRIRDILGDGDAIYSNENCPSWAEIKDGDILVGMDGDFNVHRWSRGNAQLNQRMCTVNGNSEPLSFLLSQYLPIPLKIINVLAYSTTVKHLSSYEVLHTKIPIPPDDELEAINSVLACETAHIDVLISKQQRLIELLQEKRVALISHVVTKGLNPDAPMKDSGVEWLGQVPEHWEVRKLLHVTEKIQIGPFGSQLHAEEYITAGIPVINPAHIVSGSLTPDDSCSVDNDVSERLAQHRLTPGEIIFARRGEMGRCAIVPQHAKNWLCGTGCLHFSLLPDAMMPKFAYMYLGIPFIKDYLELKSVGATLANLNTEILGNIPCVLPPIYEQQTIVAYLDRETSKIDSLIAKAQRAISLAQEHRAALISAAVTGKVCVLETRPETQLLSEEQELFYKLVLSAAIISQLYREATFGRIKHQKLRHLCEYHAQLPFQHSDYRRYPEGPLDPKTLYHHIEPQLKERGWFEACERGEGEKVDYVPLEKHTEHQSHYATIFAAKHNAIQKVIDLLRKKDTDFCGMVSTLYGSWNDFLLDNHAPTDEEIIHDVRTNWDDKKQAVAAHRWSGVLQWMKKNGLTPSGWGKSIQPRGHV